MVLLLLKLNQFSLAEAKKKKMSLIDDEDLATHLAHIYLLVTPFKYIYIYQKGLMISLRFIWGK